MGLIFSSILALSCFISSGVTLKAEDVDTTAPEITAISKSLNNHVLHIAFTATDDLSQVNVFQMYGESAEGKTFSLYSSYNSQWSTLVNDGNNQYHVDLDLNQGNFKNGQFEISSLFIEDKAGNNRSYMRSCADSVDDYCSDQLPGGISTWKGLDLTIAGITELNAPILTKFQPVQSMQTITAGSNYELYEGEVNINVSNLEDGHYLNGFFYYYNETTNSTTSSNYVNLSYRDGKYLLTIFEEAKYAGSDYKFLYADFYTSDDKTMSDTISYSFMTPDELSAYTSTVPNEIHSLNGITDAGSLDFHITNSVVDHDAPVLNSVKWDKNKVNLPGTASLQMNVKDDVSGVQSIEGVAIQNGKEIPLYTYSSFDQEYIIKLMLGRYHEEGNIQIEMLKLTDKAGNEVVYCQSAVSDKYEQIYGADHVLSLPAIPSLKVEQGQKYDVMLSAGDADFLSKLKNVKEGQTVVVDTSIQKVIKKEVFNLIKGKYITLIFDDVFASEYESQGVQWIFHGKDITGPIKDINLKTSVEVRNKHISAAEGFGFAVDDSKTLKEKNEMFLNQFKEQPVLSWYYNYLKKFNLTKDNLIDEFFHEFHMNEYAKLVFQNNGELPGKAKIRLRLSYALRDYMPESKINAYYVNDKKYELVESDIDLQDDDSYEFTITHNSDYVLTSGDIESLLGVKPDDSQTDKTTPSTGDTTNKTNLYLMILLAGSAVGYVCMRFKKS